MLCQNCNENEANVRYTQIINGEKKELMFCDKCSKKLGIDNINFNMPINLSSFFGDLLDEYNESSFMPLLKQTNELKCNNCNMTYEEFMSKGKFGCPECYNAFSERIDPLLKRIHGSDTYLGRRLNEVNSTKKVNIRDKKDKSKQTKLDELQTNLKKAIEDERYEDAAKIRDEIKKETKGNKKEE